ncbi:gephyrin-like molybdotransferase receptor GlpR [Streptomyces sp. LaPpAH-108]|uniref:divisome protein SepX/GlpR n=1 Tax=Streptomyces sp. LaPpAH-108 TaxID=1155714 RepID=UPI0003815F91|nr:gephyrin-like molybdotransferase receptor GlpR [Streptomyces sp. LaPpAH-108]
MSSSGLIYAVIVGAWAAYLVPMWLRRQDELNEARPTERFSTAIRLLSGRAGMERRYAKDLRARSAEEGEPDAGDPDTATDSVDVRAFAMPPTRRQARADVRAEEPGHPEPAPKSPSAQAHHSGAHPAQGHRSGAQPVQGHRPGTTDPAPAPAPASARQRGSGPAPAQGAARRGPAPQSAAARAQRSKVLARRRRTTVVLFLAFTCGAIVAAVGGLAFLWVPAVPALLLSGYIAYLRTQERRRFAYQMDRRRAEDAARQLRENARRPRRRATVDAGPVADEPEEGSEPKTDPALSAALAADRRALVEQTDHAEWVDQQRERTRPPGHGDSWEPVPVPLPTYVTAPVAPRATPDVDLGAPDTWSSARSGPVVSEHESEPEEVPEPRAEDTRDAARRAASARRSRERGRTPLFDQYETDGRPRAANE